MKRVIYSITALLCFIIINFCFFSKVDAAGTVDLNGDIYTVNESNEYNSTNKVKWITIKSDRSQGARMSMEMDLDLVKEYNSSKGIISYKTIKNWLNKLEDCFTYFSELNLNPKDKTLIVEFTGVSSQMGTAYGYSRPDINRIVMTKNNMLDTLKLIERDYNSGITYFGDTILHEMGHMFTKINGYSYFNTPWNYGLEYINLVFVQYVTDKMIKNNDNIVINISPYREVVCASKNIAKYTNLNNAEIYVEHSYKDAWNITYNVTKKYEKFVPDYAETIYNTSVILDAIRENSFKKACNSYFNNDMSKYNISDDYNRFITFMNFVKASTTSTIWNKVKPNYDSLYNKFVVNINIKNKNLNIVKGKTVKIEYDVSYNSDTHDNFSTSYKSSNENIATVDSNGNIIGKSVGKATIFVHVGNQYGSLAVNVVERGATSITLNKSELTINSLSTSYTLSANVVSSLSENLVEWTSSNTSIASVDSTGRVFPVGNGTCKITATTTDGTNISSSCNITVDIKATELTLDKTSYNITRGNFVVHASVKPYNVANKSIKWTSSNEDVAVVSQNGIVTPIGKGNCTIIATTTDGTNLSACCNVTSDVEVGFSKSQYLFDYDATQKIELGSQWKDKLEVTEYSVDNTNIAFIVADKFLMALNSGTTVLRAKVKLPSGKLKEITADVVVNLKAKEIKLNNETLYITENIYNQLIANILPSNTANKKITWKSSNEKVAVVNSGGIIEPLANGTCTITATTTDGTNLSATCSVTVNIPGYKQAYDKGDINKDGKINMLDTYYGMKKMSNGTLTDEEIEIGDVTGDSKFNMVDVNKMLRYIAGKISTLD